MMMSETIELLAAALCKAQAEMPNAIRNKVNPHFRSNYADLANIITAARPSLTKYGLAVTQVSHISRDSEGVPAYIVWRTMLMHTSGQWIASDWPVPWMPDKPQVMGSNTTYARRYGYSAVTGLAAEDDDDAEAASSGMAKGDATTPTKAKAEKQPIRMTADESATWTGQMLERIEQMGSVEAIDDFAKENAGAYGRLLPKHQQTVKEATNNRRAAVSSGGDGA